ncbi:MAG TPA: hypothetical protein VK922_16005 [Gemmatimonadaceae bacterium]|nr:hypothetical protein [Gemmatimonadaceae bacterium]
MATDRLALTAGLVLVAGALLLGAGGYLATGEANSWDAADAFAADSARAIRRAGMLLSVLGVAALVVSLPVLVARLHGTRGFPWALGGWVGFAAGSVLFAMVLGLTAIALPALGELAALGAVSPQEVADRFVRQPALIVAFIGANVLFMSWVFIGVGLHVSGRFPKWLGWFVAIAATLSWLGFLHVPGIEGTARPFWPLSIALTGVYLLRQRNAARSAERG